MAKRTSTPDDEARPSAESPTRPEDAAPEPPRTRADLPSLADPNGERTDPQKTSLDLKAYVDEGTSQTPLPESVLRGNASDSARTAPSTTLTPMPEPEPPAGATTLTPLPEALTDRPVRKPTRPLVPAVESGTALSPVPEPVRKATRGEIPVDSGTSISPPPEPVRKATRGEIPTTDPGTALTPLPEPVRKATRGEVPVDPGTAISPQPEPVRKPTRELKSASGHAAPLQKSASGHAAPLPKSASGHAAPLPKSASGHAAPLPKSASGHATPLQKSASGHASALPKSASGHATPLKKPAPEPEVRKPGEATALLPAADATEPPSPQATALLDISGLNTEAPRPSGDTTDTRVPMVVPRRPEPDPPWKVKLNELRAKWDDLGPDRQLRIQVGGAIGVFVLVSVIGVVSIVNSIQGPSHHGSGQELSDDEDPLLRAGQAALADRRYEEAVNLLEQARHARPDSEGVKSALSRARDDASAVQALKEADAARNDQRYTDARDALQRIADGSDLDTQKKVSLNELDEAESRYLYEKASTLMKTGHEGQAAALIQRLAKIRPELAATLHSELPAPTAAAEPPRPTGARPRNENVDPDLSDALEIADRDPSRGAEALDHVASTTKKPQVAAQARTLAYAARRCADAMSSVHGEDLSALERADSACAQVNPGGRLAADLERRRVDAANAQAATALTREDWGRAAKAYRSVLQVRPSDAKAKAALDKLLGRAHDLYMQGYVAAPRDPDSAAHSFTEALKILAPGDADYDKAKAKLEEVRDPGER